MNSIPEQDSIYGVFLANKDKPRYEHVCAICGMKFSDIVQEQHNCAACTIRELREEWDSEP